MEVTLPSTPVALRLVPHMLPYAFIICATITAPRVSNTSHDNVELLKSPSRTMSLLPIPWLPIQTNLLPLGYPDHPINRLNMQGPTNLSVTRSMMAGKSSRKTHETSVAIQ